MFCSEACIAEFVSDGFVSLVFFFLVSPAVVALGLAVGMGMVVAFYFSSWWWVCD